ncbi:uncharacterized protein LOC21394741, partial [Morus notabilis]|uniref:uncharacterized protein LOC21394741 n=1 Tax=Morus notabilis TaxID=981085 RepID=UPI000CED7451
MDMEGLSAICAGLGVVEEDRDGNRIGYSKGEYCLDNLKDLLRFLRRDDPQNRDVFKQVCKWNTVSKDLIPIIEHCQEDRNLVLNAVKVLVFLTMPIEPSSNDISDQIEYLWRFKSSITCSDIVAVIVSLLESPLENLERDALTEDDWKLVQLILTLFRNILAIQEISLQQKAGGTASHFISLRDKFLELLFRENVMDLIIVITQHFGGYLRNDNLLLLDIFHYAFMGQEPELVAKAHLKGPKADENSKASLNSLKSIMEEEEEKRKLSRVRNLVRHSHFIGTFSRLTMDGSKAVFNAKPTSVSRDTLIKPHKVHRGPTKKIAWDHGILPSSKDEILKLLHDFVNHFLSGGGYNVLMQLLREDIEKEHHSVQQSDVIVFFQVAQFVTSFQYYKFFTFKPNIGADTSEVLDDAHADKTHFGGDMCGPIAASMNESMFQLVFSHWRNTFEGLKETHNFKFLSAAGSLMKNMICMLDLVLTVLPEDSKESQTARILLYKLFYDQTDQGLTQFLLNLLKSFDTHKQAKSDLENLTEMICKVLQLMENLQARGTLRVSKKSRKGRKKKALKDKETKTVLTGEPSSIQSENGVSNGEQPAEMGDTHKDIQNTSSDGNQETINPAHIDKCQGSVLETDVIGNQETINPAHIDKCQGSVLETDVIGNQETINPAHIDKCQGSVLETDVIGNQETINPAHIDKCQGSVLETDVIGNQETINPAHIDKCQGSVLETDVIGNQETINPAHIDKCQGSVLETDVIGNQETINPAHTDKCEGSVLETDVIGGSLLETEVKNSGHANDDLYDTGDSSGDEQEAVTDEVDFNASTFVSSFASNNIIQKLCWLLKFYKSNSTSTNDYIIRMLRRISDDLELSPMLYQLSLLTTFYDILAEQKSCPSKEYANIVNFLTSLVRKMLKKMKNQPLLFVEALFWKTRRECHYINAEYLLHELGHYKRESKNWQKNFGNVGIGSSQDKEWTHRSIADALGDDEADVVITHDLGNNSEEEIGELKGNTSSTLDGGFDGQESNNNAKKAVEHASERVAKIKKRIVLGSELDEKIRNLYEKFKDSQDCSQLIAEDLDSDGRVSSLQVSKKLKQLGLKRASRKRLRRADVPSSFDPDKLDGEKNGVETVGTLGDSNDLEKTLLSQPAHARKRVRAFSEDQEATIRTLYEQYKDHKRCSYMIANALDADNKFTASQVSRKLKQLGLCIPRQKRSQTNIRLRDDDLNDISADKVNDSDDETLLSLMNGRKKRENGRLYSEDVGGHSVGGKLSEDDSHNEMLASIIKKKRLPLTKSKVVKRADISIEGAASEDGLGNGAEEGVEERSSSQQSGMSEPGEPNKGVASNTVSLDDNRETEEN